MQIIKLVNYGVVGLLLILAVVTNQSNAQHIQDSRKVSGYSTIRDNHLRQTILKRIEDGKQVAAVNKQLENYKLEHPQMVPSLLHKIRYTPVPKVPGLWDGYLLNGPIASAILHNEITQAIVSPAENQLRQELLE